MDWPRPIHTRFGVEQDCVRARGLSLVVRVGTRTAAGLAVARSVAGAGGGGCSLSHSLSSHCPPCVRLCAAARWLRRHLYFCRRSLRVAVTSQVDSCPERYRQVVLLEVVSVPDDLSRTHINSRIVVGASTTVH